MTSPTTPEAAVARARTAQPAWSALGLDERIRCVARGTRRMLERSDEVLGLMRAETGKVAVEALLSEALGPLDQLMQWAKLFRRHFRPRRVRVDPLSFPGKRVSVELVPRGVVGSITPWNYPLATLFRPTFPALLAGNGLVLKPAEQCPRTARWFVDQLAPDLPDGLVQVVHGGADAGRALVAAGIDACTFTGSVAAGREVARSCGERLIPCSVELGGNDAAIVLADCDLERTLAGVTHWALHNAGQNCGAIERVYVEASIADEFVARLAAAFDALQVGGDTGVCPVSTPAQLEVVERHVADARAKGADVRCGGARAGDGLGYLPTVLDRCTADMAVVRDESFGPLVAVTRVADAAEALRLANDGRYGLGGSVWTRDLARGRALAARLECGIASVNNHGVTGAMVAAPWSGLKDTGPGVANSAFALTTFARPRTTLVDRSRGPDLFWLPFDRALLDLGRRITRLQLGARGGAWKLPALAQRRIRTIRAFFARTASAPVQRHSTATSSGSADAGAGTENAPSATDGPHSKR